jgi:hypothetical protein
VVSDVSLSLDYQANFPNEDLRQDIFVFEGTKHTRPVDQNVDLRLRKDLALPGNVRISPYLEVLNLFNDRWVFLSAFERASIDEQRRFVESGFDYLPDFDASGRPIVDVAKFRNLPRQVIFGVTVQL